MNVRAVEGAEERVWVRNIIWFILLIGIVVFSILLFLLVMDPISYEDNSAAKQTVRTETGASAASGGEEADKAEENPSHDAHTETSEEQGQTGEQGAHEPASSASSNIPNGEQATEHKTTVTEPPQGKTTVSTIEENPSAKKKPSAAGANGEANGGAVWYPVGQGVGYITLILILVPYLLFSIGGRKGRMVVRRLGRSGAHGLSFLSQLAIAVAALHGGMMLRLVESWDRHLLAGVWLFVFIVLFFLRVSLYNPVSPMTKGNPFAALTVIILLLYVIHSLG